MKNILSSMVVVVVVSACGARTSADSAPPAPAPLPDSVVWNEDPELAPLLRRAAFGPDQMNAAVRVAAEIGPQTLAQRLAGIAEDTTAPAVVRINALNLLAQRKAVTELFAFSTALRAREERVRMAAVSGIREFLPLAPTTALSILELALRDPNLRIQARALEMLSDRDADILRAFLARATNAELRGVALDLLRTAEERGAPLAVKDSAGTLERTTATGFTITFRPTQRWPEWDAAVGELFITVPGRGQAVRVASQVEVVANVVPAFVTPDSMLVYEANREIRVRSLRDQADRKLADGVAPRVLPFTNDVIYFRELKDAGLKTPADIPFRYQVLRVSPAGGQATAIGELKTTARNLVKGNYSPVRWARVREVDGRFYVTGDAITDFELPSPFGS